ncbi:MAG: lytic transglycosylase domain-containing protein [Chloroflexi bacterium]|nr:lytic transglycosylase domain-containing protein [Chloroflexota bacterium]
MKRFFLRLLPAWLALASLIIFVLPTALATTLSATGRLLTRLPVITGLERAGSPGTIAPFFTEEVQYWSSDIRRWAVQYDLDPNLLATIMQIESCGDHSVSSSAGAQGLFQVMPFHFATGENHLDPDTNVMRGANHLNLCLEYADGDVGTALACYNAGFIVIGDMIQNWPNETQRYYNWGLSIYSDAQTSATSSASLQSWLDAGGSVLCNRAAQTLGLMG